HAQRPFPGHAGLVVALELDLAARIAHLHHRAGIDEQTGHGDGLDERAATVAAQIHHQSVDVLVSEFVDEPAHVARAGAIVGLVVRAPFKVDIEHRHANHADAAHAVTAGQLDHFTAGGLLFELD